MARKKKDLLEVNMDNLGVEEINEINVEFPEIPAVEEEPILEEPLPEEPSVEEQIAMATAELEQRCNDLTHQLYYKEQEIEQLRKVIDDQATYFDKTVSNLVQILCGPNRQ